MTAPNLDYASTPKPALLPKPATCAYHRCQAGGVILPSAPRVVWADRFGSKFPESWHPGCWAAEQRARQVLDMSMEVTAR